MYLTGKKTQHSFCCVSAGEVVSMSGFRQVAACVGRLTVFLCDSLFSLV